jgi:hypothetical protein
MLSAATTRGSAWWSLRHESCRMGGKLLRYGGYLYLGSWCRGLTCLPVTEEIAGSNPVEPARNHFENDPLRGRFLLPWLVIERFCYE